MFATPRRIVSALAVGIALAGGARAMAQETGKTKDDALDSSPKRSGSATVAPKDQELDQLLQKFGATKDEPSADDRPRNSAAPREPQEPPAGNKAGKTKLGAKDKDIDARLEEYTGRKKKRQASDQETSGPLGEIIKEMRDVEQRLGKPDPSETTQTKQKQIIKRIDTLIEQARRSGSSSMRMTMRRVRQAGQEPGQQQGQQPGALARGAPPMKPARPTSQHSTAGGKDIWGHLPAELRQVMENSFKEMELSSKAELISRYFLSINKGKLVREE
jgi:hypothetical protein